GGEATQVDFTNNCPFTVWPGTSIDDDGITQLPETGFILLPDQSTIIELAPTWSFARFWGRTECSYDATGNFTCLTGDCGTGKIQWSSQGCLSTLLRVPWTFFSPNSSNMFIFYAKANSWLMCVQPVEGNGACKTKSCEKSVNRVCPPELAVRNSKGRVVACKSACMAFQKAQYCCEGYYSSLKRCPPSSYAKLFKAQCPDAYSYPFDNNMNSFCPTGKNYIITFCP
ncbi:Thaumatin-like protein 1a, partial [Linum perenne]